MPLFLKSIWQGWLRNTEWTQSQSGIQLGAGTLSYCFWWCLSHCKKQFLWQLTWSLCLGDPCLNFPPWPKYECRGGDYLLCLHLSSPAILYLGLQIHQLHRYNLLVNRPLQINEKMEWINTVHEVSSFLLGSVLNEWTWNAHGAIFFFAVSSSSVTVIEQINLKGAGKETSLDMYRNQPEKLLLKKFHLCLGKKANQYCRSVISFQITEDVVHCCQMGLWQEVNQLYLLHRLTLQWPREKASLCTRPALQGLDKIPCSEASTALRHLALFTLPKQAEDAPRSSTLQKRWKTLLWVVRLKSDWRGSK